MIPASPVRVATSEAVTFLTAIASLNRGPIRLTVLSENEAGAALPLTLSDRKLQHQIKEKLEKSQ